jgi:uncharacterized protein
MAQGLGILLPIQHGNMGYFRQGFDPLEQIKSNFLNLVKTRLGERLHQPHFGCGIHDLLFEPMTQDNLEKARQSVIDAVAKFLPYLELIQIEILDMKENVDKNTFRVYVKYILKANPALGETIILNF